MAFTVIFSPSAGIEAERDRLCQDEAWPWGSARSRSPASGSRPSRRESSVVSVVMSTSNDGLRDRRAVDRHAAGDLRRAADGRLRADAGELLLHAEAGERAREVAEASRSTGSTVQVPSRPLAPRSSLRSLWCCRASLASMEPTAPIEADLGGSVVAEHEVPHGAADDHEGHDGRQGDDPPALPHTSVLPATVANWIAGRVRVSQATLSKQVAV